MSIHLHTRFQRVRTSKKSFWVPQFPNIQSVSVLAYWRYRFVHGCLQSLENNRFLLHIVLCVEFRQPAGGS